MDDEENGEGVTNLLVMSRRLISALTNEEKVSTARGLNWADGLRTEKMKLKDGFPNRMSKIDLAAAEKDWAVAIADAVVGVEDN